jgi:ubiquinone/menaquinone biosynthesis C-methylase UbiE
MDAYLEPGKRVLEIGPGGGRWTIELLKFEPSTLVGVDLTQKCVDLCTERFKDVPNVEFKVNDGKSLPSVDERSIDFVWSFDVFVHMEADTIAGYFREFARVLDSGGIGVVHYPSVDRAKTDDPREGWRGDVTSERMLEIVRGAGLTVLQDYYEPWISQGNTSVVIFQR